MKKYYLLISLLVVSFCLPSQLIAADGQLIKSGQGSAVYYHGQDGLRYVFPNQSVYNSWYSDFSEVVTITHEELISKNLGGVVCYKPNTKLVKIVSDPKVYWVGENCLLRHVPNEKTAADLFGMDWVKKVDILSVVYFDGYTIGFPLEEGGNLPIVASDLNIDTNQIIVNINTDDINNDNTNEDTNTENNTSTPAIVDEGQQPVEIKLTAIYNNSLGKVILSWLITGGNTDYGLGIIKATKENPVAGDGEFYELTDKTATVYDWFNIVNGDYYFRVCRLNSDGSCGTYSNTRTIAVGSTSQTPGIALTGQVNGNTAKLNWQIDWLSPEDGFYLVRGYEENPRYPANLYIWFDKTRDSYEWSGLSSGTYHFRICSYENTGTLCVPYSNDLSLTIE